MKKYEITFMSGYTPITEITENIVDKGNAYYFENIMKVREKEVVCKYTIGKKNIISIKEVA